MIILYNCGGNRPMGETAGGDRPQRGFIVGETAPNAVLYSGGDRPQRGFIWRLSRGSLDIYITFLMY